MTHLNNKKEVLFIGDSITQGYIGESYLKIIKENLDKERYIIHNHGLGGDTLEGVKTRLIQILSGGAKYDVIVIEVGHNDIVLPYLAKKSPAWEKEVQMLREEGIIPEPLPTEFEKNLENTLKYLKTNYAGEVIVSTLSCLGENLDSEVNKKRKIYNNIIRNIVNSYEYKIADVGRSFDDELKDKQENIIEKELVETFLSPSSAAMIGSTDKKFFLTYDGVHINKKGAQIYAKEIIKHLY